MESSVSALEIVSLVAGLTSIVLAVVALVLAILFFRMSTEESREVKASASQISSNVGRLEKLFDTLYNDTFAIMKDTVTDMREHIYHRVDASFDGAEEEESPEADPLLEGLVSKLDDLLGHVDSTATNVDALREQLETTVASTLAEARKERLIAEAEDPRLNMRQRIGPWLFQRTRHRGGVPAGEILAHWKERGAEEAAIVERLFELREKGMVEWDGPENALSGFDVVRWVRREDRESAKGS